MGEHPPAGEGAGAPFPMTAFAWRSCPAVSSDGVWGGNRGTAKAGGLPQSEQPGRGGLELGREGLPAKPCFPHWAPSGFSTALGPRRSAEVCCLAPLSRGLRVSFCQVGAGWRGLPGRWGQAQGTRM